MQNRYDKLCAQTKAEYPRFNVKQRDRSWLRPIFWVLKKVTGQDYKTFTTTVFSTMYVGPTWEDRSPDEKWKTLSHEKEHVRQFHCWPLGRWAWPLNHLLMALCYLLCLPVLFTLRSKFEREGYAMSILAEYELHGPFSDAKAEDWARWLADTFGGSAYAWMWTRKKAYAWAMETIRKVNAGELVMPQSSPLPLAPSDRGAGGS